MTPPNDHAAHRNHSMEIRAVIVDDEKPARDLLREYLEDLPNLTVIAECENGFDAVKAISELNPELIFLDVQMPKLNGFEVLELLEREVAVIFTTAYDEFALKAFEISAVDYLLKPFTKERCIQAVERARSRIGALEPASHPAPTTASLVAASQKTKVPLDRILIRDRSRVEVIPTDAIDYIEAQDDYVSVVTAGRKLLKQQTLNELESLVDLRRFVRIHRSFLLNIDRLDRIELYAKDSRVAILKDGSHLPVSRAGYRRLKELL